MNRRHFLKATALAAVAVPVVGLPEAVPAAAPAQVPAIKPDLYRVQWEFITSKGELQTPELDHALSFARSLFCEWLEDRYPNSGNDIPSIRVTRNGRPVKWMWNWTGSS